MRTNGTITGRLARTLGALLIVAVWAVIAIAQDLSPEAAANAGRAHYKARRYGDALVVFEQLIADHPKHEEVVGGNACWYAARCQRELGRHADAVTTLEAYLKAHPKGEGVFNARIELFWANDALEDYAAAQAVAKWLFKRHPDAKGCFPLLLHFVLEGWKIPKLGTSGKAMKYWTFTRLDGREHPDARLVFLDLLRKADPKADLFKDGGVLYCQAWAHQQAGRFDEAAKLGEKFVKKYPKASGREQARLLLAEVYLALETPDLPRARKHLEKVLASDKTKYHERASELLTRARTQGDPKQNEPGFPSAEGVGKVVLLTNLAATDSYFRALDDWREARGAEVVKFRGDDLSTARKAIAKRGPEFVAVLVRPETVGMNFHLGMLEFCRDLDWDPMPDFRFGYLTARDAADLETFAARILAKHEEGGTKANMVAVSGDGSQLTKDDFILHFGHGTPTAVVKGMKAPQIAALKLDNSPTVFSGACFNGVLSRSYHACAYQPVFRVPDTFEPDELISMAWVHAGATGLFAALEGDRGEMAMAEWEYFRSTAEPLGAVIDYQYRLAFTSLSAGYRSFPRYQPGARKRMGFYDVMLRGQISRLLLGDPSYKPLKQPLAQPANEASVAARGDGCTITVKVLRTTPSVHLNYLPKSGKGHFDWRITERVELPEGYDGILGPAKVVVTAGGKAVKLTRHRVRHEAWGGRRFVTVQVESEDGALVKPGSTVTMTFSVEK